MEAKIIKESLGWLVVEKPAGMVTTVEGNVKSESSLENWLRNNFRNDLKRQGIIHRLDKDTSGLVLVAKTEEVRKELMEQFKKRSVVKKYLALVGGDLPKEGEINMPVGRSKYGFGKFGVTWDGKEARTLFKVIGKYIINGKTYSLTEVELKTGRTHQIRVHFSYLKWPLFGDKVYGGETNSGLLRQFLHACYLEFSDPETGKRMVANSKLPPDLEDILSRYEKLD